MVKSIMIDAVPYSVEKSEEPVIVDARECSGSVNYNEARIKIRDNIWDTGPGMKTLMHEVMHALLYERGLYDHFDNEELVEHLGCGIISLIRQNPLLIAEITDGTNST